MSVEEFYEDMVRKIGSEKFNRLSNYKSRGLKSLICGVFAGVAISITGSILENRLMRNIGFYTIITGGIVASRYCSLAGNLEREIDKKVDTIRKGGVIDND